MDAAKPIALVGLSGAGKTAVAARLGDQLRLKVADLDAMIEAEEGGTVAEFFARNGEPAFRRREARALERALAEASDVVACGGGAVLDAGLRRTLRERCRTVWLQVTPETAERRTRAHATPRPLLAGADIGDRLATLLKERSALYAEVAVARVATDGRSLDEVVHEVTEALRLLRT